MVRSTAHKFILILMHLVPLHCSDHILFGSVTIGIKVLSLPKELVVDVLREGARRVARGLVLGDGLGQRLEDDLLLGRLAEDGPGDPDLLLVDKAAVEDALVAAVAQDLDGVADVHDNGTRHALGRHPLALVEELKAGHHVVEDEGECAHVGVSLHA